MYLPNTRQIRQLCLLPVLLAGAAQATATDVAACPADQTTVFACTTTNNKQVQVCDAGQTIRYTFGRPGRTPELALSVPRQQATTWQWHGIGRSMTYSVTVPNGDARYTVYTSVDRMEDIGGWEAGINVEVKGQHVASLPCREKGVIDNLEGIDLPPTELD